MEYSEDQRVNLARLITGKLLPMWGHAFSGDEIVGEAWLIINRYKHKRLSVALLCKSVHNKLKSVQKKDKSGGITDTGYSNGVDLIREQDEMLGNRLGYTPPDLDYETVDLIKVAAKELNTRTFKCLLGTLKGKTRKEVGKELGIAISTVSWHIGKAREVMERKMALLVG